MLMAGIEKRADVDGFMQKVDDKLSDLRCEIVSERASSRQELAQMKVTSGVVLARKSTLHQVHEFGTLESW